MRHRFTVALYDEYPVEAEILDYLVSHGRGKRQEVLRMLVKAGYAAMLQHKDASSAMMNAVDPDALALVVQALSGAQSQHHAPHNNLPKPSNAPPGHDQPWPQQSSGEASQKSESSEVNQEQKRPESPARSTLFDDTPHDDGFSEFEPEEESVEEGITPDVDEDDLEDPMAKLMSFD